MGLLNSNKTATEVIVYAQIVKLNRSIQDIVDYKQIIFFGAVKFNFYEKEGY